MAEDIAYQRFIAPSSKDVYAGSNYRFTSVEDVEAFSRGNRNTDVAHTDNDEDSISSTDENYDVASITSSAEDRLT